MSDNAIRRLTAAAVLLVAAIAAVVSFTHIRWLALSHGQAPLAAVLLPVSIDGTVAASSLVMVRAARAGLAAPGLARFGLGLSVSATLACNVGYGIAYGMAGALLSGWPAVAFVVCAELAVGMLRRERAARPATAVGGHEPDARPARARRAVTSTPARPARERARSAPVTGEDAEREFMPELASGALPSIRQVRARMHVGDVRARALRDHLAGFTGEAGTSAPGDAQQHEQARQG